MNVLITLEVDSLYSKSDVKRIFTELLDEMIDSENDGEHRLEVIDFKISVKE